MKYSVEQHTNYRQSCELLFEKRASEGTSSAGESVALSRASTRATRTLSSNTDRSASAALRPPTASAALRLPPPGGALTSAAAAAESPVRICFGGVAPSLHDGDARDALRSPMYTESASDGNCAEGVGWWVSSVRCGTSRWRLQTAAACSSESFRKQAISMRYFRSPVSLHEMIK